MPNMSSSTKKRKNHTPSKKSWKSEQKRDQQLRVLREDEAHLSEMLFGDADGIVPKIEPQQQEEPFDVQNQVHDDDSEINDRKQRSKKRKRVWQDDDNDQERERQLRKRYIEQTLPASASEGWASLRRQKKEKKKEKNTMNDVFQTTKSLVDKTGVNSDRLVYRCASRTHLDGSTVSTQFHHSGRMALVATNKNTVDLFKFNDGKFSKIHQFQLSPYIRDAQFSCNGEEIYIVLNGMPLTVIKLSDRSVTTLAYNKLSKSPLNFVRASPDQNYLAGAMFRKEKLVSLLCAKSKNLIKELHHNAPVNTAAFSKDSHYLYTGDAKGMVYIWDMRMQSICGVHQDKGASEITCVSPSSDGNFHAVGSSSGIVNVYSTEKALLGDRFLDPSYEYFNLTQPITDINWDSTDQLMCFYSREQQNGVRMAHIPSFRLFPHFPQLTDKLHKVSSMDFSPDGKYAVFGAGAKLATFKIG